MLDTGSWTYGRKSRFLYMYNAKYIKHTTSFVEVSTHMQSQFSKV